MFLAPDYNSLSTPYGLQNSSSHDLFDALNAAIADVQRQDKDEKLLTENHLTDLVRAYSCRQDTQLPVPNRNVTTGYLRDILFTTKTLKIGGVGPFNWGVHDGDYTSNVTVGFFPRLLETIVQTLGELKGPDGVTYGEGLKIARTFYPTDKLLFQALLNGSIHATDVYLLVDAPYEGTGEACSNATQCRARESCTDGACTHPPRSRSIHFRTTCTTATRTTKFITKKNSLRFPNDIGLVGRLVRQADAPTNRAKTLTIVFQDGTIVARTTTTATIHPTTTKRWIGFLLLFSVLFGSIFLTLLAFVRRKKNYRIEQTLPGGIGKFARLQEESEPPMEGMDSFDDHIVQSPADNTRSTT